MESNMSRYLAGNCKLFEKDFNLIEENVKPQVYSQFKRLNKVSEWRVNYGFDFMSCGWFFQFTRVGDEDKEGEQTVDIDYLFDKLNGKEFGFILKNLSPTNQQVLFHAECGELDTRF
jgi:hypothetical protein